MFEEKKQTSLLDARMVDDKVPSRVPYVLEKGLEVFHHKCTVAGWRPLKAVLKRLVYIGRCVMSQLYAKLYNNIFYTLKCIYTVCGGVQRIHRGQCARHG